MRGIGGLDGFLFARGDGSPLHRAARRQAREAGVFCGGEGE